MIHLTFPIVLCCILGAIVVSTLTQLWVKFKYPGCEQVSYAKAAYLMRVYIAIPVVVFWHWKTFQFDEVEMTMISYLTAFSLMFAVTSGSKLRTCVAVTIIPAMILLTIGAHIQNLTDKGTFFVTFVLLIDAAIVYYSVPLVKAFNPKWS